MTMPARHAQAATPASAAAAGAPAAGAGTGPLAFITGASSGIGQALALLHARMGWRLALVVRQAERTRRWIDEQGLDPARCAVYQADVADVDQIVAAAQACLAAQGLPERVIASAGISVGMDSRDREDLGVLADTLALNVVGLAATFHAFIEPMVAAGRGVLVPIASVAGVRGLAGHGAYCASKAAVVAYGESLRAELRGSGVRVVTLLPGFVDTRMTRRNPYAMPFKLPVAVFAQRAERAMGGRGRNVIIPWPMAVVAFCLRAFPAAWVDRLLSGRGRKPRRPRAPPAS
jgi:short-subunit dehydrogenase